MDFNYKNDNVYYLQVAERVADERCEPIGQSVGYQIRLEQYVSVFVVL